MKEVVTATPDDPTAPILKRDAKTVAQDRWKRGLYACMHVDMHKTNLMSNNQAPDEAQIPSTGAQEHAGIHRVDKSSRLSKETLKQCNTFLNTASKLKNVLRTVVRKGIALRSTAMLAAVYVINSRRIPGVPAIAVLLDSGAEVNIENDARMFIERLGAPKVRIALADSESTMQCNGYGKCRRWYYDRLGRLYIDEYWAYYCPQAPYAIRSTRDIARTGGTVVENPGGKGPKDYTTVVRGGQHIRLTGSDTNVVMSNGPVLVATPVGEAMRPDKNVLAWLTPIQPTRVQHSDSANERTLYAQTTATDAPKESVDASIHALAHQDPENTAEQWQELNPPEGDAILRREALPRSDPKY